MDTVKLTVSIDAKTHKALKIKLAQNSTTIQAILEKAIMDYVKKDKAPLK